MKLFAIPTVTEEKQQLLKRNVFEDNLQRCKLFARVVIFFETILITMNILTKLLNDKSLLTFDIYLMMYTLLLVMSIIMLLYIHRFEKGDNLTYKKFRIGILGFVIFFLVWGAVITLIDQQSYGHLMAFIVNVICVSILFLASARTILLLYITPITVLFVGLPFFQSSSVVLIGHYINLVVFLFFCWLASRLLYTSYANNFYNKLLLTESNESLAQKIEENERINQKLEKANDRLKQLTIIDELTKIPNRRGFQQYINKAMNQNDEKRKLSIVMLDIDAFKLFNDNYGHLEGDKIIRSVAQKINGFIDPSLSLLARFGGEEFILANFENDETEVFNLGNAIRRAILEMKIPHEYSVASNYVTVSIGIATKCVKDEADVEQLIRKADEALYKAKELGRNRIEVYK